LSRLGRAGRNPCADDQWHQLLHGPLHRPR
jgi:hypothetical protein